MKIRLCVFVCISDCVFPCSFGVCARMFYVVLMCVCVSYDVREFVCVSLFAFVC